jgi:hypothetical protein
VTCLNIAALAVGPWPEGVLYRYPTVFGATVDVTSQDPDTYTATCRGCDEHTAGCWDRTLRATQAWAQEHSQQCRALPKPAAH